jgi:hypothetical protein
MEGNGMAKRQRIKKFKSDSVQGKGSYAVCASMTVAEQREARKFMADGGDMFELGTSILKTHVLTWDWVDDDGEPLPQPKDCPEVIDLLTDAEVDFLSECIKGSEADAKN